MSEGPSAGEWDLAMTSGVERDRVVGKSPSLFSVKTKNHIANLEASLASLWLSTFAIRPEFSEPSVKWMTHVRKNKLEYTHFL